VIVRAALVPHPPSPVPEPVAGGGADVSAVREAGPVAAVQVSAPLRSEAAGTFAGFGVDVVVRLGPAMPRSALVAERLRERVDANQVTI
jgi:hypothetical protein